MNFIYVYIGEQISLISYSARSASLETASCAVGIVTWTAGRISGCPVVTHAATR